MLSAIIAAVCARQAALAELDSSFTGSGSGERAVWKGRTGDEVFRAEQYPDIRMRHRYDGRRRDDHIVDVDAHHRVGLLQYRQAGHAPEESQFLKKGHHQRFGHPHPDAHQVAGHRHRHLCTGNDGRRLLVGRRCFRVVLNRLLTVDSRSSLKERVGRKSLLPFH